MRKRTFIISSFVMMCVLPALAAMPDRFINKNLYANTYPNTINQTVPTQPKDTNVITSTKGNATSMQTTGKRRVIKRTTKARAATTNTAPKTAKQPAPTNTRRVVARPGTARSATQNARTAPVKTSSRGVNAKRNVVARSAKRNTKVRSSARTYDTTSSSTYGTNMPISSQRCFANYKDCMEGYCERANTAYNRCYCSAKLAQIDSRYQNKIDELTQQIVKLQYSNQATSEEIKEYWDKTMKSYTGTNPWVNIDNALNINWADTESRVRGQNAFNTGHQYCVKNLSACSSMASNMRDAYKSEINRDCAAYEASLQKIQLAAETIIENYND